MQTTSAAYDARATGQMRPLSWKVLMSFEKALDPAVDFFTIGESTIGGTDIIKGDNEVIQEWDQYEYLDYSDRLISLEWTRHEEAYASIGVAMADFVLENHDDYFSPGAGSEIDDFILPRRPVRLFAGFGGDNLPVMVGLTEKMPIVDKKTRQAAFHAVDFLDSIYSRKIPTALTYEDMRTDEILLDVMDQLGLLPTNYQFDTGFNRIAFVYWEAGTTFGHIAQQLIEAEMGRFYLNESGVFRFKNRQNYDDTPVHYFDASNVIDITTREYDDIVNAVEINSNVRAVQALTSNYWELDAVIEIPPMSAVNKFAEFDDPVTTVTTPIHSATPIVASYFTTNDASDGSGATVPGYVALFSTQLFGDSYLMTFVNSHPTATLYVTAIGLQATPAKVVNQIRIREVDQTSIDKYDEQLMTIDNDLFQDEDEATSRALIILADLAESGGVNELTVPGNPAYQIGDTVSVGIPGYVGNYIIRRIVTKLAAASLVQILTVRPNTRQAYFTIGESLIGGTHAIAP